MGKCEGEKGRVVPIEHPELKKAIETTDQGDESLTVRGALQEDGLVMLKTLAAIVERATSPS